MLAISRALMARPKLMLLDEPSLGLAPSLVRDIFRIIQKINDEEKTTILLVEQNANLALSIADFGYIMENGRVVQSRNAADDYGRRRRDSATGGREYPCGEMGRLDDLVQAKRASPGPRSVHLKRLSINRSEANDPAG